MGTSAKGILLSGIYCMLGLYNFSFLESGKASTENAIAVVTSKKSEQLSSSAAARALAYMGQNEYRNGSVSFMPRTVDGNTVNYFIEYKGSKKAKIYSTVITDEQIVTTIIAVEFKSIKKWSWSKENGGWHVTDMHTKKSALKKTKK